MLAYCFVLCNALFDEQNSLKTSIQKLGKVQKKKNVVVQHLPDFGKKYFLSLDKKNIKDCAAVKKPNPTYLAFLKCIVLII